MPLGPALFQGRERPFSVQMRFLGGGRGRGLGFRALTFFSLKPGSGLLAILLLEVFLVVLRLVEAGAVGSCTAGVSAVKLSTRRVFSLLPREASPPNLWEAGALFCSGSESFVIGGEIGTSLVASLLAWIGVSPEINSTSGPHW